VEQQSDPSRRAVDRKYDRADIDSLNLRGRPASMNARVAIDITPARAAARPFVPLEDDRCLPLGVAQ